MIFFKILDNTETDQNWKIVNKFGTYEIGEDSKEEDDQSRFFGDIPLFNTTNIYNSAIAPDALAVLLVLYFISLSLSLSLSLSFLIYISYFSQNFAIAPDALAVLLVPYFINYSAIVFCANLHYLI